MAAEVSEMIERMAEAMYKVNVETRGLKFSELVREMARAAIAELRKPTEAMLDAGPPEPYMDRDVWAKMIDAALLSQPVDNVSVLPVIRVER